MKNIVIAIIMVFAVSIIAGCATCPNQDIWVLGVDEYGRSMFIPFKKGVLDDPNSYYTEEEMSELRKVMESERL